MEKTTETKSNEAQKKQLSEVLFKQQYILVPHKMAENHFSRLTAEAFLKEMEEVQPICEVYRSTLLPPSKTSGGIGVITHVQGKKGNSVELAIFKLDDPHGGRAYFSAIPEGVPAKGGKRYLVLQSIVPEVDYNKALEGRGSDHAKHN